MASRTTHYMQKGGEVEREPDKNKTKFACAQLSNLDTRRHESSRLSAFSVWAVSYAVLVRCATAAAVYRWWPPVTGRRRWQISTPQS